MSNQELIACAQAAKSHAYAPYSGFAVGAAVECEDGTIFTGCNVENAAYGESICAERVALTKAVSAGQQQFRAIAIIADSEDYCLPCGSCRQVMMEFCNPEVFTIVTVSPDGSLAVHTLAQLLPHGFGPGNLSGG